MSTGDYQCLRYTSAYEAFHHILPTIYFFSEMFKQLCELQMIQIMTF